ncbi:MAG: hypothetical protein ACREVN_01870 [Gammaproteobacteria bacterium]
MNTGIRFLAFVVLAVSAGPAHRAVAQAEEDFGPAPQQTPQEAPTPATAPAQTQSAQIQAAQPTVIASTDGEQPGMRVEVTELKRSGGGVVTLKFALINDSSEEFSFGYDMGDGSLGATDISSIGGVHLIDNEGKKKYQVIRDADNKCVCSRGLDDLEPGSRLWLWARFPAPPADVQSLSVMIPHFIPMDGVPLSQ